MNAPVWGPLAASHPLVRDGLLCVVCRAPFVAGDLVMAIDALPADPTEQAKADQGLPYVAEFTALGHLDCPGGEA